MRFLLRVAYDGTKYCGWQLQPSLPTIEGELNKAISRLLGSEIQVIGASRTDAGVHAHGNVAVFDANTSIPADKLKYALNNILPEDIVITESRQVEDSFHPRHTDCIKTYSYKILNTDFADPVRRFDTYHYRYSLDIEKMRQGAKYIVGEHDFACFMAAGSTVTDTVRTVYALEFTEKDGIIEMRITGNGFLYNMVRIIAGTMIHVGGGKILPEKVEEIVAGKDRSKAGPTAPAKALTLEIIRYPELGDIYDMEVK